jgi:pantetheine-phosphate adenylyltransferase
MKTIAIYPGSFNPFTIGHYNILEKAEQMFDQVIIAVGVNPLKKQSGSIAAIREKGEVVVYENWVNKRCALISTQIGREVVEYVGYFHKYVLSVQKANPDAKIIIVRGLRNGDDLDYEINQLRVMEDLINAQRKYAADYNMKFSTVFINCDREFEHVSSTVCRAMEIIEPNSSAAYIFVK